MNTDRSAGIRDAERLHALLGRPELARLIQRLRTRLERGQPLGGTLILSQPSPAERDAVDRLLGRPPSRGTHLSVPLDRLEEVLQRALVTPSLSVAVEELTGPIVNRPAARAAAEREWEELFTSASTTLAGRADLSRWLTELRACGALRRYGVSEARRLLAQALQVLDALPAPDISIAELAANRLGDAHGLDPDTSLASLVLRAISALGWNEPIEDAHARREAWASVGVICDELSGPVLVLNLLAGGSTALSQVLATQAVVGEPIYITIRQLLQSGADFTRPEQDAVYVCENPSVVAAAARRLGPRSRPLVCIEGQPRTATRLLLNRLRAADIELRYHGDFDWPGIQIANTIMTRHGALPWRMRVQDYEAAATGSLELRGTPVAASWEPELMRVMQANGKAVHEEQVTEFLLADLARRGGV